MSKREFSILYPDDPSARYRSLSDTGCHDLGLPKICEKLTPKPNERAMILNILRTMTASKETAAYRIGVFRDICRSKEMRDRMLELLNQISFLNDYGSFKKEQSHEIGLWDLLHRFDELRDYIRSVEAIRECLLAANPESDGLLGLKDYVEAVYQASLFSELKNDIASLGADTDHLKSITVGINLNSRFEVESIGLISVNKKEFKSSGILKNFSRAFSTEDPIRDDNEWDGETRFIPAGGSKGELAASVGKFATFTALSRQPILGPILATSTIANVPEKDSAAYTSFYFDREISKLLGHLTRKLERTLSKYISFSINSITDLIPEFLYYVRWAEFLEKKKEEGFRFSTPCVTDGQNGCRMKARDLYNLFLAVSGEIRADDIVPNDLDFDTDHTIYLLTGANRGGKTTFTQAVGLCYVLAQGGISTPAGTFEFTPVDCIYTHYPADEDKTLDLGRLGEECRRFRDLYRDSTDESLLLLNETFSTTSFEEGYYIAKDAVRALMNKGVRTIYNTHMHKLAAETEEFNKDAQGARTASLVAHTDEGVRSFRVTVAPPEGRSYARDIAEKYGVTYDMLTGV